MGITSQDKKKERKMNSCTKLWETLGHLCIYKEFERWRKNYLSGSVKPSNATPV